MPLVETETGVICGGFGEGVWVNGRVRAKERLSSSYSVVEHQSGETRKWSKTGSSAETHWY
jgi:hypothetical protein